MLRPKVQPPRQRISDPVDDRIAPARGRQQRARLDRPVLVQGLLDEFEGCLRLGFAERFEEPSVHRPDATRPSRLRPPVLSATYPLALVRSSLRRALAVAQLAGVDPRRLAASFSGITPYLRDWKEYTRAGGELRLRDALPALADRHAQSGTASGEYFHQDLWAARKIFLANPTSHVDVGSRVDGFIAHLLSFRAVTVVDVRPLDSVVNGLTFVQDDGSTLTTFDDHSVESLSSLHAVEHFGLGRYGDPVDPSGHLRAIQSFARVCAPGGTVYFSCPIGAQRTYFNGNRVLDPVEVIERFSPLHLEDFAHVDATGKLRVGSSPFALRSGRAGCGLFEFRRVD